MLKGRLKLDFQVSDDLCLYSGLNLNQDKARQRRTGLKLIHYTKP